MGQVIDFGARRPPARAREFFLSLSLSLEPTVDKRAHDGGAESRWLVRESSQTEDEGRDSEQAPDWPSGDSRWARRLFLLSYSHSAVFLSAAAAAEPI